VPTIQEIIGQIRDSEILLPEFQRGYVWNRDKVRAFARALYRKHPTGHLLVWKTHQPSAVRGNAAASDGQTVLLLDGQQRLTSLFVLFYGKPPPFFEGESLFFDLYFNVQTEEFRFWQKSLMAGSLAWISVHDFFKETLNGLLERLPKMTAEGQDIVQQNLARYNRLDSIRSYVYQVDTLSGDDLTAREVVEIFNEVNSAGTTLNKADLAFARVSTVWPEARSSLRNFSIEMARHGFEVDLDFLIRCVAGVASNSILLEGSFFQISSENLQAAWKLVAASFEHLVNVLRHEAYVDSISDLPSANVLIPITVYLARNGSIFTSETIRAKFLRWMYLAGIWGRYSGSAESALQSDVSLLGEPDPTGDLVDAILKQRGRIKLEPGDISRKSGGTALYKFSYIVARARGATDWFSGVTLYKKAIGRSSGLEDHHIFPKAVLYKNGYDPDEHRGLVNEVANRAFLTQKANRKISSTMPESYLPDVQKEHPGALQAQSVPMNMELWRVEKYRAFLAERSRLLATSMNAFLDSLVPTEAAIGSESRVQQLLDAGESASVEFKSSLRSAVPGGGLNKLLEKAVIKTVAGFLNAKGGTLLIGVADDGTPIGLEGDYKSSDSIQDRDGFELHLVKLLTSAMGESISAFITVTFHDLGGKDVCQIVAEPSDHPIYVQDGQDMAFFLRTGNATNALPVHEVVTYVSGRWA
jgi:hypothetical protein